MNTNKSKNCLQDMSPYIFPHILSSLLVVCIQCPTVQALMWTFQYFSVAIFTCGWGAVCALVNVAVSCFPCLIVWGGEWDPCPSVAANVASLYCPRLTDHCYLCPPPILLLSSYHPAQPLHLHQPLHPPNPTSMIIWSTFTCNIFCLASSIGVG